MEDILIIGAGGVGKETALLIEQINYIKPTWNLLGFLDDNGKLHGSFINGYKVFGGVDYINNYKDIYAVCAMASGEVKRKIIDKLSKHNIKFPKIIHPSVSVPDTTSIGDGTIIYPGVIMTTNIMIGKHVIISPGCGIGHESVIEDFCSILWNVSISGNVRIGTRCVVGSSSTILQNIKIGMETTIGAGAVVLKDVPQRCTVVGVPAKIINFHDKVGVIA